MKTSFKIIRFWLLVNYNQIFIVFCLVFFMAQICRFIFNF